MNYKRQLECVQCSNQRSFVIYSETSQTVVGQTEAAELPRGTRMACGRCGCTSLISCWTDAVPYATTGYVGRRRRRRGAIANAEHALLRN